MSDACEISSCIVVYADLVKEAENFKYSKSSINRICISRILDKSDLYSHRIILI